MNKKRSDNFDKFSLKKKGSAVKEAIRQDKKKAKAESRALGEALRQRKKDKARGIITEPLPAYEKGKRVNPTKKSNPYSTASARPAKYGSLQPSAPQGRAKRTPAAMDKADEKRTASIGKVTASNDTPHEQMPLNKYIAHAGISGRREAAEMVKSGHVTVNGDTILEPGYKVQYKDVVRLKGKVLQLQVTPVYILLNKPKDYICTANDPEGRKTVLDIIKNATTQRMFPVGRLDRNTTGVLLLTNDGDLAQKLTHPSYEIKKIYEVTLDKPVTKADMEAIAAGVQLEDGFIAADAVSYLSNTSKNVIGIEIHSGRNRIVRRIFEHLGYDVRHLDRVMFANMTKKNVDRGKWRFLSEKEVRLLKFMNKSFTRKSKQE
ncbi:MAG: rRNA pseudouridine synthase [Chitinophagia bacterium]|jgi:23S rRNA pseudouridine2605 synthase|nr:rRNA pseudouridine synthase [Chitinophagia bacterium]